MDHCPCPILFRQQLLPISWVRQAVHLPFPWWGLCEAMGRGDLAGSDTAEGWLEAITYSHARASHWTKSFPNADWILSGWHKVQAALSSPTSGHSKCTFLFENL